MPTLDVGAAGLMAVAGEMRGKALKGKGNAEREERRGGESLEADEGINAGCGTVVEAAVVAGTRIRP